MRAVLVGARLEERNQVGLRQLPQLRHLSLLPVKDQGACRQAADLSCEGFAPCCLRLAVTQSEAAFGGEGSCLLRSPSRQGEGGHSSSRTVMIHCTMYLAPVSCGVSMQGLL